MSMLSNVVRINKSTAASALFVVVLENYSRPKIKFFKGQEKALAYARDILLTGGSEYGTAHVFMGEKRFASVNRRGDELEVTQVLNLGDS